MQPMSDRAAWARKVGRFVLVLGMLAGAVFGGTFLGQYLLVAMIDQGNLARAATALGIAAVLALVKEGLGLLPGVISYLKTGQGEGLYRLCGFAVVAAATVTVSVPTLTGGGPDPGGASDGLQQPGLGNHVLFLSRRGETTFVVPFFQEAELCAPPAPAKTV